MNVCDSDDERLVHVNFAGVNVRPLPDGVIATSLSGYSEMLIVSAPLVCDAYSAG